MAELVVVAGPTASGKTSLALDIAERLGGPNSAEIVNADSMQVYRGMDIGTAKIRPDERRGIAHHLFDLWPITHPVSVAEFRDHARRVIAEVRERGRMPILVGGSGLYITATIDDLRFPGTDPAVRARLEAELHAAGPLVMHRRLRRLDPRAADSILATNGRRIVRALEVIEITGEPFTATLPHDARPVLDATQIGIDWPTEQLYERIERRVAIMWRDGLVEEVRGLRDQLENARTASRALGYAQVLAFLRGEISEAEAQQATVTATRRFARRQRSWFARDPRIHWLDGAGSEITDQALRRIEG